MTFLRRSLLVCAIAAHATMAAAQDRDGIRPYFALWAGGSSYAGDGGVPGLKLTNPGQYPFPQFTVGVNFDRFWGVEFAINFDETNLEFPGLTKRMGEYATWTFIPQIRLRYPFLDDRLVPYVTAGVGLGLGEFNDRNVLHRNVELSGPQDTTTVSALGLGVDYFVAQNLALSMEAKHIFGWQTDIVFQNTPRTLEVEETFYSAGFRLHFDKTDETGKAGKPGGDGGRRAADRGGLRGYIAYRIGLAFNTGGKNFQNIEPESPRKTEFGVTLGMNFNRHWGADLTSDYWEPALHVPGAGYVAEYALYTILMQARYRYPIMGDRLVPYALLGGGLGFTEVNDRRVPYDDFRLEEGTHTMVVGAAGGGIEYFVQPNLAVGFEARYVFGFQDEVKVAGQTGNIDNDTLLTMLGIRLMFP